MSAGARIANELLARRDLENPSFLIDADQAAQLAGMSMAEFGLWMGLAVGRFPKCITLRWLWPAFRYAIPAHVAVYDLKTVSVKTRDDGVEVYDMIEVWEANGWSQEPSWPQLVETLSIS